MIPRRRARHEHDHSRLSYDADLAGRQRKAIKIVTVLRDFLDNEFGDALALDIGCSTGVVTKMIAADCQLAIGIDLNRSALREAGELAKDGHNLAFGLADGRMMPFGDSTFDIVICAQVYEHVSEQSGLAAETWRVLKPGGVCFFSGPNKLAFMEEHYFLPLLSWLPKSLASAYMRAFRRGPYYDITPLYYWQLKDLWKPFTIHDYTVRLVQEPARFAVQDRMAGSEWIARLPVGILKRLMYLYPNYNWILEKPR